jgi:hypothetical protein
MIAADAQGVLWFKVKANRLHAFEYCCCCCSCHIAAIVAAPAASDATFRYLPQGPKVPALYRFLWQLQYLISQGFYIMLDFSSTRDTEPNVQNPALFAQNWSNFWRILSEIPAYKQHMQGRIFPDLINEPSRWGCEWDTACNLNNGSRSCAPALQMFGMAAAAIWRIDPSVPIFLNGLGQDDNNKFPQCRGFYPGMHWGDGFITNAQTISQYNLSDPSAIFTTAFTKSLGPFLGVEKGGAQVSSGGC